MNNIILEKLKEIEKKENIKILLAVESGSRAWGFAGKDSDYDVRFIYVRKKEDYLKLEKQSDVLEYPIDNMLDINGWDLKKVLRLCYKSNPTIFEWLKSPIIYIDNTSDSLKEITKKYYSKSKILNHYYHISKDHYENYIMNNKQVKIKKYFYVLRGLLAACYVLHHDSIPPIEFKILQEFELDNNLNDIVNELLEIKINDSERKLIDRNIKLDEYIENKFAELDLARKQIQEKDENDWKVLNEYFIKMIKE